MIELPPSLSWWSRLKQLPGLGPALTGQILGRFFSGVLLAGFLGLLTIIGAPPLLREWAESSAPATMLSDWIHGLRVNPMPAGAFNILVADLVDDDDVTSNTSHIEQSLVSQLAGGEQSSGVRIQRARRPIRVGVARDVATEMAAAQQRARNLLKRLNGDVMVWGTVLPAAEGRRVLRLWLALKDGASANRANAYALTPTLELPDQFGQDLGGALAAVAASQSVPALEEGRFVVEVLSPLKPKLERLVASPPRALGPDQRMALRETLALLLDRIGDQKRDYAMLEQAAAELRAAGDHWRGRDPSRQALALSNLGRTLLTLSERAVERAGGKAKVEEAIAALEQATGVIAPETSPELWSVTRWRLAEAFRQLGEMEEGGGRLEQSEAAIRQAIGALGAMPAAGLLRAHFYNQLGDILRARAERATGTDLLDDAEKALRQAISELKIDDHALLWAEATGNLADVLRLRGERTGAVKTLEASASAYDEAYRVWQKHNQGVDAAAVLFKRCTAVRLIGEHEAGGGAGRLAEALKLCEQSLQGLSRQDNAVYWGEAQLALSRVQYALAERQSSKARLQAAKTAVEHAIAAFTTEGATSYLAGARSHAERIAKAPAMEKP